MPTVDVSVAAGADDGNWSSLGFFASNTSANFGDLAGNEVSAFFRFDNVGVPAGATIDTAHITFVAASGTTSTTINVNVTADDADDPAAPTSTGDANGRTRTTASVAWSPGSWTTSFSYDTPEIKTVIQELVDRAGWASGQAMLLFLDAAGSSTSAQRLAASEENTTYAPAELHIEYTEPSQGLNASPSSVSVTGITPVLAASGSANLSASPAVVNVSAVSPELVDASITAIQEYGSSVPEQPRVTLMLFDEHRRERLDVDINSRLVSVQLSTAVNRGFDQLNIGLQPQSSIRREDVTYGQLPEPIDIRPFARAELRIGGYTAFEGRLMPTNVPATSLTVRGDWDALSTDDWFASTDTTEDSAGEVIKTMLASSVLRVRPGDSMQFVDPQVTHAPAEFDGRTVADALTQVIGEGDALGNTVDWYIWEDRRLWLMPRVEPADPDYRFDLDPATMQVFSDPSNMLSGLVVEYTISSSGTATITSGNTSVTVTHGLGVTPDASRIRFFANNNPTNDPGNAWVDTIGSTSFQINVRNDPGASGASFAWFVEVPGQRTDEASNADFYREFGFQRRQKVNVGKMTQSAAERIRDRLIADAKRPRYSARVRVGPGAKLAGPRNEPIAKHVARAGQWGRIANLPLLIAVSTRYDVTGDVLDIDFGERLPTLGDQIRRLQLSEERRRRNIDPESGGSLTT